MSPFRQDYASFEGLEWQEAGLDFGAARQAQGTNAVFISSTLGKQAIFAPVC